jgi:MoaD family protein
VFQVRVRVKFAAVLRPLASSPTREVEVEDGSSVASLLKALACIESPKLLRRLLDEEGCLQPDVLVLVNGVEVSALQGVDTRLKEGDEVLFLPSVHGGSIELQAPWWDEFYFKVLELARMIRRSGFKPDVIVGVARGGWVVARLLSDFLGNPNVASVKVEFYSDVAEHGEEPAVTQPLSVSVKGLRVVVADDVADTGRSLEVVKRHVEEGGALDVKLATVYYKPWSRVRPDYYVEETTRWIIFPHEVRESLVSLLKRWVKEGVKEEEARRRLLEAGIPARVLEALYPEALSVVEGRGS